jgi:predicted nuclease of predicted toxin-antitoxin system
MKVLLDECIPRKFKESFVDHACWAVPEAGLAGKKNGVLLSLAEERDFDVFLTLDKGIEYQQNLAGRKIAIIVIRVKSNRLAALLPHADACPSQMRQFDRGSSLSSARS